MLYLLAAPSNFFKMLNFFQSNNEFQIWDQMSYLGISKLELEKTIVIFKIKTSQNAKFSAKQKKSTNLGPNMPYVDIFEIQFCKGIVIFEISTLDL